MQNEFIKRELGEVLKDAIQYFPVLTLTGPRQSGKTTLLRNLFKDLPYYSLENFSIRDFAINDPVAFLEQHKEGMILDEVHNTPDLLSYIQEIVDNHHKRKFILSGSSQFSMLKRVTQSLAGRTGVFQLMPFSYNELKEQLKEIKIDEIILNGFYPTIHAGKNIPKYHYPAYVKTYLEKDVRDLLQIKDMMQFHTFLRLCAGRIGSVFNASELSNEVGVSSNTISSWVSVLQASYIIFLLPPYFDNNRKRLTKSPKIYFTDTGLACYLLGIESTDQLIRDKMRGAIFENFLITEALKFRFNRGKESNIFFYRDSHQNEVDLIIRKATGLSAVEIKSSMTFNTQFEKTLHHIDNWITNPIIEKAIVYTGTYENVKGEIKLLNFRNFNDLLV